MTVPGRFTNIQLSKMPPGIRGVLNPESPEDAENGRSSALSKVPQWTQNRDPSPGSRRLSRTLAMSELAQLSCCPAELRLPWNEEIGNKVSVLPLSPPGGSHQT